MTDVLQRPAARPDAVLRYADHPDGLVDLHLPEGEPRGLLVLVHGGFWRAEHDRTHTRPMADDLRRKGFAVATPEYRRTGAVGSRLGGWPRTFEDVRAAVARLPDLLAGLGVAPGGATSVLGHSAGGHLALCLAAAELPLSRVVALAPVGDLRDAWARDLDAGAVRDLMGGGPEELPEEYDAADPAVRLAAPPACEVVVLHGTADDKVPLANSDWATHLDHVDLRVLDGADHFDLIDPESAAWAAVLEALEVVRT